MQTIQTFLKYICFTICFGLPLLAFGQDRCGAVEYKKLLKDRGLLQENNQQFEDWLKQKQAAQLTRSKTGRTKATSQIPVVIHVIHNGEVVGVGKNISDAQILSQISVLNKDYKRLNADAPQTPAEFIPVAGAFDVEFVLAKQSPEGLATTGIVRVQGAKTSWTMSDNYQLKSQSYWPAEDYLNIWVCNLTDFLGYAQFPVSALPGLENASTNRLTDGVVIAYNAFGSSDNGSFSLLGSYDKGRTATHEVGHFFGLNHIWGDDDGACTGTDNVDDTPNQGGSTGGCPTHPRVTCDVTSMFQNYLDYTNDACMNLFTLGQVSRMQTVVQNSPRRASLPASHGLSSPAPVAHDLGIKTIVRPLAGECNTAFVPTLEVRNYGSNAITSARIQVRRDGTPIETKDMTFSPSLSLLESRNIVFASTVLTSGSHSITFQILLTNTTTDGQSSNNTLTQTVDVPQSISLPFLETFNTIPASWKISNPDQNLTWQLTSTNGGSNSSIEMNLFAYEDHVGEIDALITPVFNLSTAPAALLKFDVSYSRFQSSNDGLKVIVLGDCNSDLNLGTVVYNKFGESLSTTSASSSSFTPSSSDEWRTEIIDLSAFAGQGNFQVAFVSYNDWGNNIFLDNIGLTTSAIHDVVLNRVVTPSPVTCNLSPNLTIHVTNAGTLISSLRAITTVNGVSTSQTLTELNFSGNTERDLQLAVVNLQDGANEIIIELTEPDGDIDFFPDNNSLTISTTVNQAQDIIPLRQNFSGTFEDSWVSANPLGGEKWESIAINGNPALYVNNFTNPTIGDQSWLVSPVLDFTGATEASLLYDASYAFRSGKFDRFFILASKDCGNTFSDTLYNSTGLQLAGGRSSESSWKPAGDVDWDTKTLNLSALLENSDVRLAFVVVNDKGNNFYIDNIEFFVSAQPKRISEEVAVYPNPVVSESTDITFNLSERQDVMIDLVDGLGKVVISQQLSDVLNQTYPFSIPYTPSGVYIVKVTTHNKVYVRKILLVR